MSGLRQQRRRVQELTSGKLFHLCISHVDWSFFGATEKRGREG